MLAIVTDGMATDTLRAVARTGPDDAGAAGRHRFPTWTLPELRERRERMAK